MKILISSDGIHAHYYERMAWANAFNACGFQTAIWDCKNVSAFDVFDTFNPDIFIGQAYNLDEAIIKCIYERPHLKVALRAGDWGDHESSVDMSKYQILFCSQREKHLLNKLKQETGKPDFVYIHYSDEAIKQTHNHFSSIGIEAKSVMMSADIFSYSGATKQENLVCDIGFVGGYWPYKGQVINRYLFPLLNNVGEYNVKIFGNQAWPVNQYCGLIADNQVKNLFVSASICPNLSEPHAEVFGFDVNERIFKILFAGGFCISDYVESYKMFGDGLIMAESPEDFKNKIDYYLSNPEERARISNIGRNIILKQHTCFHRASEIMKYFGLKSISEKIMNVYGGILNGR
jgi:spore maturation protein CgeB